MSNLINTHRFSVDTDVEERGFIPELVSVVDGSYYNDSNYGAGAQVVNTYGPSGANVTLPRGTTIVPINGPGFPFVSSRTGCSIRQHDKNVEFNCCVSLSGNSPGFPVDDEIRIRPLPPTITQPARWNNPLPKPLNDSEFFEVEILNASGASIILPAINLLPRARILVNGWLTLYYFNVTDNNEISMSCGFVDNNLTPGDVITFIIRGKYLAA